MKVLFVLQSIGYGGSMTSLINLMTLLQDNPQIEYKVLFMDPYGELLSEADKVAEVCNKDVQLEAVSLSRSKIKQKKLYGLLIRRFFYFLMGKFRKCTTNEIGFQTAAKKYDNQYDCIIAYQESVATDFVSYIKAKRHIAWIHNDYENVLKIYSDNRKLQDIYAYYDKLVCVSKAGADNFKKYSGIDKEKITYIYNTLLVDNIREKASVKVEEVLSKEKTDCIISALNADCIKFVSSGRFALQKRFDRVIDAAAILRDKGYRFKWFILGNGILFDEIANKIEQCCLNEYVYLTGGLVNPFPMVKACDVFVLTSEFEAHPMVVNEALIVGKPVISTNFESACEVVCNRKTGIICGMEPEQIANVIMEILNNEKLFSTLKNAAINFKYSNQSIIDQVMQVIFE